MVNTTNNQTKKQDRSIELSYGDDVYTFDETEHVHKLNGKPLTGVTTLIDKTLSKPALIQWATDMCAGYFGYLNPKKNSLEAIGKSFREAFNKVRAFSYEEFMQYVLNARLEHSKRKTDAGDWGTRVHNACEIWCETGNITQDEDILPSVMNFVNFIEGNGFKVLGVERPVWSKEWWIGGIFDLVLEKDGKVYIADIKTSSGIYDSHFIQMGAYYKCLLENGWQKDYGVDSFTGAIVINLKKDNKMAWCMSEALDSMVDCYAGLISIYRNRDLLEKVTESVRYGTNFY